MRMLFILIFGLIVSACAEKKQLKEMHDSTEEMNKTTTELLDQTKVTRGEVSQVGANTKEIKQNVVMMTPEIQNINRNLGDTTRTTQEIDRNTRELFDGSRQVLSSGERRQAFDSLMNSPSLARKLSQASIYYSAFEFQTWTGFGNDSGIQQRQKLMADASKQYFFEIQEAYVNTPAVKSLASPFGSRLKEFLKSFTDSIFNFETNRNSVDNKEASFNALAATLHINNRKQTEGINNFNSISSSKATEYSMLKMIYDSLSLKVSLRKGQISAQSIPEYSQEIINNSEIANKLLNARFNFLALLSVLPHSDFNKESWQGWMAKLNMLISEEDLTDYTMKLIFILPDFVKDNLAKYVKDRFLKAQPMLGWELKLQGKDEVELNRIVDIAKASLETYDFLKQNGYLIHKDNEVTKIILGMRVEELNLGGQNTTPGANAQNRLKSLRECNEVLKRLKSVFANN